MKRVFLIILSFILMLCLSACGNPPELAGDFESEFSVTLDESSYKGRISLNGGELSIALTEPYTVSGMRFEYSDKELSIDFGGHSTKANCDYIPAGAIPSVLHNTLAYISKAEYRGREDGTDTYTVMTPYGEAIIKAADGIPVSLEDPYSGLRFEFTPDL